MLRLFVSLYLAVVVGLLSINWISETLWLYLSQHINHSNISQQHSSTSTQYIPDELKHTFALVKSLPDLIQTNESKRERFEQQTGIELAIFSESDLVWLEEQKALLNEGEPIVTYNQQEQWLVYVKSTKS